MNRWASKRWLQISAPIASGLLIGLSFPSYGCEALAWIALLPLAWCWTQPSIYRGTYWAAYIGGALSNWMALSWLRTSYSDSATWFGPNSDAWLMLGFIHAVSFLAMFAYGAWFTRSVKLPMAFTLPIVWVSYEFVRLLASTAVDQMGCPWGNLGLTQAEGQVFTQVADLGGVYLLSFLVAMGNGAILDALQILQSRLTQVRGTAWGPIVAALAFVFVGAYGNWRLSQQTFHRGPTVCLMSKIDLPPYLSPDRIGKASRAYADNTEATPIPNNFDLFLWSEQAYHHRIVDLPENVSLASLSKIPEDVRATAGPNLDTYNEFVHNQLVNCAEANKATLVIGCERLQYDGEKWHRYNSVACANHTNRSLLLYDKCHPVPWKEYLPFMSNSLNADSRVPYQRGALPVVFEMHAASHKEPLRYSIACCYDVCFPSHFRTAFKLKKQKGDINFFVHCGSEGQDHSGSLQKLMLRMARLRAIETRRAFVRNISHGPSGILDSNGKWFQLAPDLVIAEPHAIGAIPLDNRQSGYVYWGESPMIAICLLGWVFACSSSIKRNQV